MGQSNIIELNGRQYDARTGAFLGHADLKSRTAPASALKARGKVIDGFFRSPTMAPMHKKGTQPQTAKASSSVGAAPKVHAKPVTKRPVGVSVKPHQPERPQTLMRTSVKKPKMTMKPAIKTQAPTEMAAAPFKTIAKPLSKKLSVQSVDPARLGRAKQVPKNAHIRRFIAPVPAQRAAVAAPAPAPRPRPVSRPMPDVQHRAALQPAARSAAAAPARAQQQPPLDVFEAAIAHATSHTQPPHPIKKRRRSRLVNVLAGVAAFLVIGGFIGYLNLANIQFHLASMQAGFHAQMPGYKPTGYALDGGVQHEQGKVAFRFVSGSSSYSLTETPSDWNSQTLLDNHVALAAPTHQTIESKGRTIYLWGTGNATWVNGGVLYEVNSNANLSANDIINLATSM